MTDEMTGLLAAVALAGLAIGRASGVQKANSILLNEREYLRAQAAFVWGEEYVSPDTPPSGGVVMRIPFPTNYFGGRKKEDAA